MYMYSYIHLVMRRRDGRRMILEELEGGLVERVGWGKINFSHAAACCHESEAASLTSPYSSVTSPIQVLLCLFECDIAYSSVTLPIQV